MNKYKFEVEIFEGDCGNLLEDQQTGVTPDFATAGVCPWMYRGDGEKSYQQGQRFRFPEEMGSLCSWMIESINSVVKVLTYDGVLPWTYENTPYKKEMDREGVTTEFIRCMDPSAAGIVVKIIRTKV